MDITLVKNANLGLSFLLELCLLAAFAYWGVHAGQGLATKILLGIGAPLLGAFFWGLFMAPRAVIPLHNPLHLIFKVILFGLAVTALAAAGRPSLAWMLGVVFVINSILALL
jgi:hypothetical protein